jgi:mycoredoxin
MRIRLVLRARRVRIHQANIWRHAEAAAIVRSVADGNETVPTVVFADGSAWVNSSPGRVVAALRG